MNVYSLTTKGLVTPRRDVWFLAADEETAVAMIAEHNFVVGDRVSRGPFVLDEGDGPRLVVFNRVIEGDLVTCLRTLFDIHFSCAWIERMLTEAGI